MDFFLLPLLSQYIMTQSSVVDIVTARPVVNLPVELPSDVLMRQRSREMIDRLQLTPEQVDQLEAIDARYQDQISALTGTVAQQDLELSVLLAGDATLEEVQEQQNKLTALRQQLAELMFQQALEIRAVLTVEQRQQIVEMYGSTIRVREPNP